MSKREFIGAIVLLFIGSLLGFIFVGVMDSIFDGKTSDDMTVIGIMLVVGGGCWLIGSASGFYLGYRNGFRDARQRYRNVVKTYTNALYGRRSDTGRLHDVALGKTIDVNSLYPSEVEIRSDDEQVK